jgi:hypothetical protein
MRNINTECTECKDKLIRKGVSNTKENRTNEKLEMPENRTLAVKPIARCYTG